MDAVFDGASDTPAARRPDAPIAADDAVTVCVSRVTLMVLVIAADLLREHAKTIIAATPAIVGVDTLDILSEAGLIDPDTLEPTQTFDLACALGGIALGVGASDSAARSRPEAPDDGEGIDALNDNDFDDDVTAAERNFSGDASPDPDWPSDDDDDGEAGANGDRAGAAFAEHARSREAATSGVSAQRLPAAASFGGD